MMPSRKCFRFADAVYDSFGVTVVSLFTPPRVPSVVVSMELVDADIPALSKMGVLDKECLTPWTVSDGLAKKWEMLQMTTKRFTSTNGLYLPFPQEVTTYTPKYIFLLQCTLHEPSLLNCTVSYSSLVPVKCSIFSSDQKRRTPHQKRS